MKVTVINGSPRMKKGYTSQILDPFIDGMQDAKAEVTLLYSSKLKIRSCKGDFQCWFIKPGECIYKDDMLSVYPVLEDTDILILATPVYIPLPGDMQNMINRLCPLVEPVLEKKDGRTRARFYKQVKIRKIMLVATGGWWELGNFDTVMRIVEELAADVNVEFGGAVLRPHASEINSHPDEKKMIMKTLKEAGYQLIKEGRVSPDKLDLIAIPLVQFEDYIKELTGQHLNVRKSRKMTWKNPSHSG